MPAAARFSRSTVLAVLLVRFVDETAWFFPFGTLESYRADLDLTYAQAGVVLALASPGGLIGSAFTVAADRFSRRAIAAGGAFAFALCLAAFASGGSFLVLAAASLLSGVAATAMVDAAEVALVDMVDEDELLPALARSNLLAVFGDLAGPAVVAAAAFAGFSWRASFWVAAGLLAVYAAALAASPLPAPRRSSNGASDGHEDETGDDQRGSLRTMWDVAKDRRVWMLGAVGLLAAPFDETLLGFTIALLERERGASAGVATLVALVGLSGGLLAYTRLAKRYAGTSEHHLLTGSVAVMTTGAVAIAVLPSVALVAAAAFVATVGESLAWLAVQHRTLVLRPGQVGTTKAVVSAIEFPGFVLPVVIGAVADAAGLITAVASYGLVGALLVALAVASARANGRKPA